MKKQTLAKVLALSLTAAMVLSSCAPKTDTKGDSSKTPESKAEVSSAAPAPIDPEAKYPEPVVVKVAKDLNAATSAADWDGYSNSDNPWTRLLLEKYNIKIEVMWEAVKANGSYKTKMDLAMATNDLPDVIHTANYSQFNQLVKNDKVEDLTQYREDYMSDLTKGYLVQDNNVTQGSTGDIGGKTMGITASFANLTAGRLIFIREDWMKELKVEEPKTIEDVIEISKKFAAAGKGRFALPLFKNLASDDMCDIVGVANAFGAFPRIWIDDGKGNAVYGSIQPQMKEALRVYADLYKGGFIDPAFASLDGAKVAEQLTSNKIGVIIGAQWLPTWPLNSIYDLDGVNWKCYPVLPSKTATGPLKVQARPALGEMMAVRKGFEHPEVLFKITNVVSDKLQDPAEKEKYHSYTKGDGKQTIQIFGMNPLSFWLSDNMTNFNTYKNVTAAIDKSNEGELKSAGDLQQFPKVKRYVDATKAGTKPDVADWVMGKLFYGDDSCYGRMTKYIEDGSYVIDLLPGYQTETMVKQWGNMTMLEDQTFVEIISGVKDVDKGFDEFVTAWNNMSGTQVTKEVNDWYKNK